MQIVLAVISASAVVILIIVVMVDVYRVKSVKDASVELSAGVADPQRYATLAGSAVSPTPARSILYLFDIPKYALAAINCPFRITNRGSRGIREISLQLEYPESCYVDDNIDVLIDDVVVARSGGEQSRFRNLQPKVKISRGAVSAWYNLGYLRPNESLIVGVSLELGQSRSRSRDSRELRPEALTSKLARAPAFFDYIRLKATIGFGTLQAQSTFDIYSFVGGDIDEADRQKRFLESAIWNGKVPPPGAILFTPTVTRQVTELVELCAMKRKSHLMVGANEQVALETYMVGISTLRTPSWDFRRNLTQRFLGVRLTSRKSLQDTKLLYVKNKRTRAR